METPSEFDDEPVVPDNSSAEITDDGRVRTDNQKNPVTPEDVGKMAESEREIEHRRTIVDHDGAL